jgi:hypothetical protein
MCKRIFKLFLFLTGYGILPSLHAQYVYLFDSPQISPTPLTILDNPLASKTKPLDPHQTDTSLVKFGMVEEMDQSNQPLDLPKIEHPTAHEIFYSATYDLTDDNSSLPFDFVQSLLSVAEEPYRNPPSQVLEDGVLSKIEKFLEDFFIFEANASNSSAYAMEKNNYSESLPNGSLFQFPVHGTELISIYSTGGPSGKDQFDDGHIPQDSKLNFNPISLVHPYPIFASPKNQPLFSFNPFQQNSFEPLDTSTSFMVQGEEGSNPRHIRSNRQRRAAWNSANTYTWEINDFNPTNTSANPVGVISKPFDENLTSFETDPTDASIFLEIFANGGVGSLAVLAYGMTGGNALNDYAEDDGFKIMTATGWDADNNASNPDSLDVSTYFSLKTEEIDYATGSPINEWLNGYPTYDNLWGVWKEGDDFYLTYKFSNLNFSPVPEPSTYFMTGALFCLIGCNRTSRQSARRLTDALFKKFTEKFKHSPNKEQIP